MIVHDCIMMNRLLVLLSVNFVDFLEYHGILTDYCCDFDFLTESGAWEPGDSEDRTQEALGADCELSVVVVKYRL